MSKFYKGERVRFSPNMNYFGLAPANSLLPEIEAVITKVKGDTYQIKGFVGFWPEHFFRKMEDLK